MSKKHLLILPILCLCALSVFSLSSAGAGRNTLMPDFSVSLGGRIFYQGSFWDIENTSINEHGFGINGFFDATYVEIGGGITYSASNYTSHSDFFGEEQYTYSNFGWDLTLLGKVPFVVGPVTIFPLAGIEYMYHSIFFLVVGAGLDVNLSPKVYLRGDVTIFPFVFSPRVSLGLGYKF